MARLTNNRGQHLLPLEVPGWLTRAVAPWQIDAAALWVSGVMLDLRSDRARIPVLIGFARGPAGSRGPLAISVLDPRVPNKAAGAFVRALGGRLQLAAPIGAWLARLAASSELLTDRAASLDALEDRTLAGWIEAWRAWPNRESKPDAQVDALPEALDVASLPRSARAALVLHQVARASLLAALSSWDQLPPRTDAPSFTELHLDAVLLGLLGRRAEAIAAIARAGSEVAADDGETWVVVARARAALEDQPGQVAALERVVAARGRVWDRLRLARARGDFAVGEPLPTVSDAGDDDLSVVREVIRILEAARRHDDVLAVIVALIDRIGERTPTNLVVTAAQLYLWRQELGEARALLARVPEAGEQPGAVVVLGAAEVLDGRAEAGLALLESVPGAGDFELERLMWVAEAQLALGNPDAAFDATARHLERENSLVAYLLRLLTLLVKDPDVSRPEYGSATFLDGLFIDVLPFLRRPAEIAEARATPGGLARLVRGILDDMGGNRTYRPTWCRRDPEGRTRLEPVAARRSGREAAVAVLVEIPKSNPAEVLAAFDAVIDEYSSSPHPFTYRGELLIWLGRYAEALASFELGDARTPTRWSYVGRAAVHDLAGDSALADYWTAAGIDKFGELASATTHVYRGERLRKLEDWDPARRDLETAVAFKPRRIGARINLALVYHALGETELHAAEIARIRADAPAYCWEAGDRGEGPIAPAVLTAMLELMVGNRSSFLHTMIDASGLFRVVPEPGRWVGVARLCLHGARDELGRAIAERWLGPTGPGSRIQ